MTHPAPKHEELSLDALVHGFPYITAVGGAMLAQAAVVCLDHEEHASGVELAVDGAEKTKFSLLWSESVTEIARRFWNDLPEATHQGA
jgi:hypothetical protein